MNKVKIISAEMLLQFKEAAGSCYHGFERWATDVEGQIVLSRQPVDESSILMRMYHGAIEIVENEK